MKARTFFLLFFLGEQDAFFFWLFLVKRCIFFNWGTTQGATFIYLGSISCIHEVLGIKHYISWPFTPFLTLHFSCLSLNVVLHKMLLWHCIKYVIMVLVAMLGHLTSVVLITRLKLNCVKRIDLHNSWLLVCLVSTHQTDNWDYLTP